MGVVPTLIFLNISRATLDCPRTRRMCLPRTHFLASVLLNQRKVQCVFFFFNRITNASAVVETHLAKPTPLLTPSGSRSILVDTTCPYLFSRLSRSVSLKCGGRLAMYRLVGSCSCCYKIKTEFVRQSGLDRPLTVPRHSTTHSPAPTLLPLS